MVMVGQQFGEKPDIEVNGGFVSCRNRAGKVAVWIRSVETKDEVGTHITDILGKPWVFKVHHKKMRQKLHCGARLKVANVNTTDSVPVKHTINLD